MKEKTQETPVLNWMVGRIYVSTEANIGKIFESHTNIPLDRADLKKEFTYSKIITEKGYIHHAYSFGQLKRAYHPLCSDLEDSDKQAIDWDAQIEVLPIFEGQLKLKRIPLERLEQIDSIVKEFPTKRTFELEAIPFFWTEHDFESRMFSEGIVHIGTSRSYAWGERTTEFERQPEDWQRYERSAGWRHTIKYNPFSANPLYLDTLSYKMAITISGSKDNLEILEKRLGLNQD